MCIRDRINECPSCISLKDLLVQLEIEYTPDMEACGIHFGVQNVSEDIYIYGSMRKLQLLFENLLYNAMSFTPAEGTIRIQAQASDEFVRLSVWDTGCGISKEDLPKIFERFYTKRKNGSGLGLYIVKTIVQEMGGSIQATSNIKEGTVFTMKLPLYKNREK